MKEQGGLVLQAMFLSADDLDRRLAEVIESHFAAATMHGSKSVMQVSGWATFGLAGADFNTARFPNAFESLNDWTDKRHRIVHRGELVKMRRVDATEVLDLVDHIAATLNRRAIRL